MSLDLSNRATLSPMIEHAGWSKHPWCCHHGPQQPFANFAEMMNSFGPCSDKSSPNVLPLSFPFHPKESKDCTSTRPIHQHLVEYHGAVPSESVPPPCSLSRQSYRSGKSRSGTWLFLTFTPSKYLMPKSPQKTFISRKPLGESGSLPHFTFSPCTYGYPLPTNSRVEVVLNCFLTRLNCFGTDRKVLALPRNKLVEARRALRLIRLYIFATRHSDHKLHNDQMQIIQIYSHSSNGFVICMLWFAYGLVWSIVCCCLVLTSLWACSIKGHRIDRTLQLQPEADIISSISRSSFLCGFPRKLKPTCFGGPTSNLICLSLPNQIVNRNMTLQISNRRGPCDLPSTLAISEPKGPSLRRDPVRYHFSKIFLCFLT